MNYVVLIAAALVGALGLWSVRRSFDMGDGGLGYAMTGGLLLVALGYAMTDGLLLVAAAAAAGVVFAWELTK